ncbi:MAG: ATP-binding protein [Acidimicrobiia bacterium]
MPELTPMDDVTAGGFETVLPATAASPGVARRFVGAALRRLDTDAAVVETAQLLVSELVTNAVVHAGSAVKLSVVPRVDRVRIEVADDGSGHARLRIAGHDAVDGRGLGIVDRIARSWGSNERDGGKSVWFELDR